MGYADNKRIVSVLRDLQMGLGVEDIAARGTDTVDFARYVVNRYRNAGLLHEVYAVARKKEDPKPYYRGWRELAGISDIAETVAQEYGISLKEMMSRSRHWCISHPRQAAFLKAHDAGFSMPQIAKWFGYDHTTILHGIRSAMKRNEAQK